MQVPCESVQTGHEADVYADPGAPGVILNADELCGFGVADCMGRHKSEEIRIASKEGEYPR